jgi:hypothetical protein
MQHTMLVIRHPSHDLLVSRVSLVREMISIEIGVEREGVGFASRARCVTGIDIELEEV